MVCLTEVWEELVSFWLIGYTHLHLYVATSPSSHTMCSGTPPPALSPPHPLAITSLITTYTGGLLGSPVPITAKHLSNPGQLFHAKHTVSRPPVDLYIEIGDPVKKPWLCCCNSVVRCASFSIALSGLVLSCFMFTWFKLTDKLTSSPQSASWSCFGGSLSVSLLRLSYFKCECFFIFFPSAAANVSAARSDNNSQAV